MLETEKLLDDAKPAHEFQPRGIAAVKLLQGVVESSSGEPWELVLSYESDLSDYFREIGMVLVIDRADCVAYLRPMSDDERSGGYERLPRLVHKTALTYDQSLLCVLLRDAYRRFEENDLDNTRCVVELDALLDDWKIVVGGDDDEVATRKRLRTLLGQLAKMKFVQPTKTVADSWQISPLLKIRLPLEELEQYRASLIHAAKQGEIAAEDGEQSTDLEND